MYDRLLCVGFKRWICGKKFLIVKNIEIKVYISNYKIKYFQFVSDHINRDSVSKFQVKKMKIKAHP